jgi:hypothetical protein
MGPAGAGQPDCRGIISLAVFIYGSPGRRSISESLFEKLLNFFSYLYQSKGEIINA